MQEKTPKGAPFNKNELKHYHIIYNYVNTGQNFKLLYHKLKVIFDHVETCTIKWLPEK